MIAIATALVAPGTPTAWTGVAVAVLMVALWLVSLRIGDVSIADPAWGPAFVVVAVVVALTGDGCVGRRWLLAGLTALWGLRLGGYLLARKLGDRREDRRYTAVRERRGAGFPLWSLVGIFGFQGLLVLVVSLPLQVSAIQGGELDGRIIPGIVVFAVGLFFEAVGDEQMRRFKADPANEGEVMDRGLWRYTRHPNYFGDFCVWWGLWLVALTAGATWWTAVGPLVMSVLLIRISGAALLEKDIGDRRPGYADYIRRTSGFIPLPPRRRAGR
jgi:steroid 5-alpha reductase family enzyme